MTTGTRIAYLRYATIATGVIFLAGIYPLTKLWPSGWSWGSGHSHYLPMILGVYATLGACLLAAARDPIANRSLIWFAIWSSVVHAGVMAVESIQDPAEIGHLWGDVAALFLVALVLAVLMPRRSAVASVTDLSARRAA
jgi:uncharacterized protein DUF6632